MASLFNLKISIPSKIYYNKSVRQVDVCTTEGYCGILDKHVPTVASIVPSFIYIHEDNNNKTLVGIINNGLFSVDKQGMSIVTDFFEFSNVASIDAIEQRNAIIKKSIILMADDDVQKQKIYDNLELTTRKLKELIKRQ